MRPSVIVISLSLFAAGGGLAYMYSTRNEPQAANTPAALPARTEPALIETPAPAESATPIATANKVAPSHPAEPEPPRPEMVERWIKDTQDFDPKTRAAAIAQLANAPKAQALPALKEVIDTGEPDVDRHIALRSLHAIALRDGDSDGQVRDLMRRAIYHGDDDGVTQTAQSLLDDVEAALAEQQPQPN